MEALFLYKKNVYVQETWIFMPGNSIMQFVVECSDENTPFKIKTIPQMCYFNVNTWNGSLRFWTPLCDFLKNIELKMPLLKILIRAYFYRKHG
jgi:hypothetical protein